MQKNPNSQSGIFNSRVLLAFSLCSVGGLLGLVALTHAEPRSLSLGGATPTPAPGTITTFTGDGGSIGRATNTSLMPYGSVFHNGYLYVADNLGNVVRRIDPATGQQIIVAGNGIAGNGYTTGGLAGSTIPGWDNIPATQAQLNQPHDVAIDSAGNLYIADFANQRVRKVDKLDGTGTITTVAGNGQPGYNGDGIPATSAQIACPTGVDVDDAGNVYISDWGNHRVRKVTAGGNPTISTVAGTGVGTALCINAPIVSGYNGDNIPATSAKLNQPLTVAHDAAGNIYIADAFNNRIRKVDTTGVISTYAGTGVGSYNGDGLPATSTQIYGPWDLHLDGSGNIYFADISNQRVRKIDATSQHLVTTVAGTGAKAVSGDGGLAIDTPLIHPWAVAGDPAGNLYISETVDASGHTGGANAGPRRDSSAVGAHAQRSFRLLLGPLCAAARGTDEKGTAAQRLQFSPTPNARQPGIISQRARGKRCGGRLIARIQNSKTLIFTGARAGEFPLRN